MRYRFDGDDLSLLDERALALADTLVLRGGARYRAPLVIRERLEPLAVVSEGPSPAILMAESGDGVLVEDSRSVSVCGLRVIGAGFRRHPGGIGVRVRRSREVTVSGVECEGFGEAGIAFDGAQGLTVEGCLVHDNGFSGIATTGGEPNRGIRIRHCRVYDQGGDKARTASHSGNGIMLYHTRDALVEFCDAAGNGWAQRQKRNNGPVGIWCATDCENIVFRDCIARLNRTQPGGDDGGGFDFDGGVLNSYMEYCYSYKNEGSGCLHCEYNGAGEWRDNEARFCALIGDAHRVRAHGEVVYFTPPRHAFSDGRVLSSLIVPAEGRRAVMQLTRPEPGEDWAMLVRDCAVLFTEAEPAPDVRMVGNAAIPADRQKALLAAAPMLTEPRAVRSLPLYSLLERGASFCAEAAAEGDWAALFGPAAKAPEAAPRFVIDLTGKDTAGCDCTPGVRLLYDSLLPGVCTRLSGGDSLISPMPAMRKGQAYTLRLTARLASPDTLACVEAMADGEVVARAFFAGGAGAYASASVAFDCADDRLYSAAVRVLSPSGEINLRDIEVYEGDLEWPVAPLDRWRRHGDAWIEGGALVLRGGGAYASRCFPEGAKLRLRAENARAEAFRLAPDGAAQPIAALSPGEEAEIRLAKGEGLTVRVYECEEEGRVLAETLG